MVVMYWNKGNSYMTRKMEDIKTLVSEHKPHIFGVAEANVLPGHDQSDLQIPTTRSTSPPASPTLAQAQLAWLCTHTCR